MSARVIHEDEELVVVHRPGRSDFTLVTFGGVGFMPKGTHFWAERPAASLDLEAVGFVGRRRKWYPRESMRRAAAVVRPLLRPQSIGYGYSMGGYAVLKHGALLGLTHGIAVAPQVSIDPADVPGDRRYHRHHEPALHAGMAVAPGDAPPVCFVAADPFWALDAVHLDQAVRVAGAMPLRLPFLRHGVISLFTSAARLELLCRCVLRADGRAMREALRQGRGESAEVRRLLGREAEARGHRTMAAALWRTAAARGASAHAIRTVKATALQERFTALVGAGRFAEARAIAAETIALQPADAPWLRWVGRLLLHHKQPDMARIAFERIVATHPEEADGWLGLVQALVREGDKGAARHAASSACAALSGDPGAVAALARIRLMAGGQGAAAGPAAAAPPH